MKKNIGKCLAIFAGLMMIFVSCASNQIENNYTDEEMMISKLDSIQKSIKENPMKSFYDFILMIKNSLKNTKPTAVSTSIQKDINAIYYISNMGWH